MDVLFLSNTEWWELDPQDLDALRERLKVAVERGGAVEVNVLVDMQGSNRGNPWPSVLLLSGSQLQTALVTTFETAGRADGIMPHRPPLPGPK